MFYYVLMFVFYTVARDQYALWNEYSCDEWWIKNHIKPFSISISISINDNNKQTETRQSENDKKS